MSGLGCRTRLAFGTRRRNFAKASLGSFKVNPRLRLGLTLNSPRLALYVVTIVVMLCGLVFGLCVVRVWSLRVCDVVVCVGL